MKHLIECLREITKRPPDEMITRGEVKDLFVMFLHYFVNPILIKKAIEELDKEEKENDNDSSKDKEASESA